MLKIQLLVLLGFLSVSYGINDLLYGLTATEQEYLKYPSGIRAYEHLRFFTAKPHIAGRIEDYDTAVYTQAALERYGVEAEIVPMEVTLSFPVRRSLQIVYPDSQRFTAKLQENPMIEELTTYDDRHIMTFNAYSASGNVTAELIFVNYGRLEDFKLLESMGISVAGKVCIVRYGSNFRGLKPFFAEERGALGVIIYSDPIDDGYGRGEVYPEGPWRPPSAVQRGSCLYLTICPGDPGKRERCGDVDRIVPSIPVIPISYEDALPLLSGLAGTPAPENWQGSLPINYNIGPGPIRVNLDVEMVLEPTTIWNVIGQIRGREEPNRRIILGNHRDAWNVGALDPNSGTSIMLELARGFGELLKQGWQPRRTIQFSSWDAEEFGLIGSVEFGEINEDILDVEAVAYINVDVGASGSSLSASASPSLSNLLRNRTHYITDPNSGRPLSEVWSGNLSPLGSGSDFAVFVNKLGVPSLDMSFSGNNGVYHSIFDALDYVATQSDPGFKYHQAMAQLWGIVTLKLSDDIILPFDFVELASELRKYSAQVVELAEQAGGQLNVTIFNLAIDELERAGEIIDRERQICQNPNSCSTGAINSINDRLMYAERRFLNPQGLPKRPWFKNVLFAADYELGYTGAPLPGVKDAIRDLNWPLAQSQVDLVTSSVYAAANYLQSQKS